MVLVSEAANVSWGVLVYGKICHREPWGMALVAGELTGAGCVDHSGRDCRWFSETRIMCRSARSMIVLVGVGSLHMQVYRVDKCLERKCAWTVVALRGAVYAVGRYLR